MVAVDLVGNKETVEQTVKALGRPRARAAAERRGFTQRMKRAPPVLQNGFEIVSHVDPRFSEVYGASDTPPVRSVKPNRTPPSHPPTSATPSTTTRSIAISPISSNTSSSKPPRRPTLRVRAAKPPSFRHLQILYHVNARRGPALA